jgi:hypothetical protein
MVEHSFIAREADGGGAGFSFIEVMFSRGH